MTRATKWAVLLVAPVFAVAPRADAVVRSVTAEVRSLVQAFVDGGDGSSDEAIEDLGDESVTPPISTRANLESVEDGITIAAGVAGAEFRDPSLFSAQRNPGEIGIEANCYSNDPGVRYNLNSSVVERRTVVFTAAELGNPVSGRQEVNSAVFISGAIFAWSVDANRDLSGLTGDIAFTVRRIDLDESDGAAVNETTLVDGRVTLRGGPNGTFTLSSPDELFVFVGDLDILPEDTGGISALPNADFNALGSTQVAIILEQNLAYGYEADVDRAFELEATFTTTVNNLPDGTGVAAVFGRDFTEAANIIELGIPAESAKSLERRLNRAMAEFQKGDDLRLSAVTSSPAPCGLFGVEAIPMLGLTMTLLFTRVRRFPRRR